MSAQPTRITITVDVTVAVGPERAWELFTDPGSITQWNYAAPTWHCPRATNELEVGGKYVWRMEARDGSAGFDFEGTYDEVRPHERLESHLENDRKVVTSFAPADGGTRVTQSFEIEDENTADMQRAGWQAILDNFKAYSEGQ